MIPKLKSENSQSALSNDSLLVINIIIWLISALVILDILWGSRSLASFVPKTRKEIYDFYSSHITRITFILEGIWKGYFPMSHMVCKWVGICARDSKYYFVTSPRLEVPQHKFVYSLPSFSRSNKWALCPSGFYLEGIYISDSSPKLYHIEEAKCCRPQNHPDSYDGCYDEDVTISFDHKGWSQCKQDGYYMAGFYKSSCNELYCIEKFRCCKMKKGCYQKYLACLFTIAADLFMLIKIVTVPIDNWILV